MTFLLLGGVASFGVLCYYDGKYTYGYVEGAIKGLYFFIAWVFIVLLYKWQWWWQWRMLIAWWLVSGAISYTCIAIPRRRFYRLQDWKSISMGLLLGVIFWPIGIWFVSQEEFDKNNESR